MVPCSIFYCIILVLSTQLVRYSGLLLFVNLYLASYQYISICRSSLSIVYTWYYIQYIYDVTKRNIDGKIVKFVNFKGFFKTLKKSSLHYIVIVSSFRAFSQSIKYYFVVKLYTSLSYHFRKFKFMEHCLHMVHFQH